MAEVNHSILIVARNEGVRLQRTIDDVLRQTPGVSAEIIVVDDASSDESAAILAAPPYSIRNVRVFRNAERRGLIASRARAAELACGHFFTFLDAHCAVSPGWLEALTSSLESCGGRGIAVPHVCALDEEEWAPQARELAIRGCSIINPMLDFSWVDPLLLDGQACTCTLGGMAWMCRRDWYEHVGGLDAEMVGWGGENIDIALRTWLAGGRCVLVPEVVVGHHFRREAEDPIDQVQLAYNKLRAAHTAFSKDIFLRILANLLPLPPFRDAFARLREKPEGLGRLKARVESIRRRTDRWIIDTFRLPILEAACFHLLPRRASRHVLPSPANIESCRERPRVSVFVLAGRESESTRSAAVSLLETTAYTNLDVTLLANENAPGLGLKSLAGHPRLRWLRPQGRFAPGFFESLGGLDAEAEYFAFMDDRFSILDAHWIEQFILLFEDHPALVLASPRIRRRAADGTVLGEMFDLTWDWHSPRLCRIREGISAAPSPYQALACPELLCFLRRDAFLRLGGFDEILPDSRARVLDFAVRAWLSGYDVYCHPGVTVERHEAGPDRELAKAPAQLEEEHAQYARVALAVKYFTNPRRLEACRQQNLMASGLLGSRARWLESMREQYLRTLKFDDDWLFYKFQIPDPPDANAPA